MSFKSLFGLILVALTVSYGQDIATIKSASLKRTAITPVFNTEITPEHNLIYCATFQLAWNELRDSFPAHRDEDPAIIWELDEKIYTKEYLSEYCYIAMAGRYENIVEKINELLRKKFGDEAWPLTQERVLEDRVSEQALMAYAFLYKNLIFQEMFEDLDEPILFGSPNEGVKVEGFGIKEFTPGEKKHEAFSNQVSIFFYEADYDSGKITREFVIGLKPTLPNEEIVIAQISPRKTLVETYNAVEAIIAKSEPDYLRKYETLQIPKLDFDFEQTFPEIERYLGGLVEGPAKAYQRIKFRLNERGAILKSEAIILLEGMETADPRYLVVSEPFLIYLKQKDSPYPYLAMWVGNEELLVKTD